MSHTPGPWLWGHRRGDGGMYNTEIFSATHGVIAICAWTPRPPANGVIGTYRDANARLIAAAPELLTSLQALVALHDEFAPGLELNIARRLIAKAAGEPA